MEKFERDAVEGDLIDLIRGHDAKNFVLTIQRQNGAFAISIVDTDAPRTEPRSDKVVGTGHTFADAWQNLSPTWATEGSDGDRS